MNENKCDVEIFPFGCKLSMACKHGFEEQKKVDIGTQESPAKNKESQVTIKHLTGAVGAGIVWGAQRRLIERHALWS